MCFTSTSLSCCYCCCSRAKQKQANIFPEVQQAGGGKTEGKGIEKLEIIQSTDGWWNKQSKRRDLIFLLRLHLLTHTLDQTRPHTSHSTSSQNSAARSQSPINLPTPSPERKPQAQVPTPLRDFGSLTCDWSCVLCLQASVICLIFPFVPLTPCSTSPSLPSSNPTNSEALV